MATMIATIRTNPITAIEVLNTVFDTLDRILAAFARITTNESVKLGLDLARLFCTYILLPGLRYLITRL